MSKQEALERRAREAEHPPDVLVGIFSDQYQAALKLMTLEMAVDHARDAVQRHLASLKAAPEGGESVP